jgi:glycerophosphoryl diester phosphodiesterase
MPDVVRPKDPLLLGHRGARARRSIPENSFRSFDQALADGCHGFEFDARLTADGAAVIWHDPWFEGREIASSRFDQLRSLAELGELLARYQDRAFLDIELKVPGLEKLILALLEKHPPRPGFVISSFLPEVLRALYREAPGAPLGLICETHDQLRGWRDLPVQSVIVQHRLADSGLFEALKAAGRSVLVWTVNEPKDMLRFLDWGVDGIISDDTELLGRTLKR